MLPKTFSILGDEPIALTEREGVVDCAHYGSAVVVDRGGQIRWSLGNPNRIVFERSIIKPIRALAVLRFGSADAFRFDEADIALIAGSHSGTLMHVSRARELVRKMGATEDALQCGVRLPIGEDALLELAENIQRISVLSCDCSGEHIGVLSLCKHLGYPLADYLSPHNPVQKLLEETIEEFSGSHHQAIRSVDRCGMPTAAVELISLAICFKEFVGASHRDLFAARLLQAIRRHPLAYTGRGRIIGTLIERSGGTVVGKCGADGVYVLVWPTGESLALKVADGSSRAAVAVMVQASEALHLGLPDIWDCVNTNRFSKVRSVEQIRRTPMY